MHSSLPLPPPAPPRSIHALYAGPHCKNETSKGHCVKDRWENPYRHISTHSTPAWRSPWRPRAPFLYFLWLNMSKSAFFIFWLDNHLHIVISSTICLYLFFLNFHCGSPPAVIRHISLFTIMFRKLKSTMLCQIDWFVSIFIPSFQHCLVPQWPSLVTGIIKVSFYLPKAVGVSK